VREDAIDDIGAVDTRNDAHDGAAVGTILRADLEHFLNQLHPRGFASCISPNIS